MTTTTTPAASHRAVVGDGGPVDIEVVGVSRSFGETRALDGVDLQVAAGTVLGLLGPNGSGKTTLVRILTTLLRPDAGRASVAGFDVVREPAGIRAVVGLAGQFAAVDALLTGRENLELVARLSHVPAPRRHRLVDDALDRLGLREVAHRRAGTYSGGQRRRLDLAAALVGEARVLLLDEPTTGLDPATRLDLWELIGEMVATGATVLLTTQYLEEVDRLADRIVVLDLGRVVAAGASRDLKDRLGRDVLEVTVADPARLDDAQAVLAEVGRGPVGVDVVSRTASTVSPVADAAALVVDTARRCAARGFTLTDIAVRRPSLDDVFLTLTGRDR